MRDRGRFQNFNFLATLHQKNTAIVIRIYTIAHIQSLSSFGPDLVEIFEVAERWVVVDVWVGVSILLRYHHDVECTKQLISTPSAYEMPIASREPLYNISLRMTRNVWQECQGVLVGTNRSFSSKIVHQGTILCYRTSKDRRKTANEFSFSFEMSPT